MLPVGGGEALPLPSYFYAYVKSKIKSLKVKSCGRIEIE